MLSTEIYIEITLIILLLSILIEYDKLGIKLNLKATLIQCFNDMFHISSKCLIQGLTIY